MEDNKINMTVEEGIREIEVIIKKVVSPLLADNCRKTCLASGWPLEMVSNKLLDNLGTQVAEKIGVSAKRIHKAVVNTAQAPHILSALRATAVDAPKKSRRETST